MLRLAPWIQQYILSMPDMVRRPAISERTLRPIAKMKSARIKWTRSQSYSIETRRDQRDGLCSGDSLTIRDGQVR